MYKRASRHFLKLYTTMDTCIQFFTPACEYRLLTVAYTCLHELHAYRGEPAVMKALGLKEDSHKRMPAVAAVLRPTENEPHLLFAISGSDDPATLPPFLHHGHRQKVLTGKDLPYDPKLCAEHNLLEHIKEAFMQEDDPEAAPNYHIVLALPIPPCTSCQTKLRSFQEWSGCTLRIICADAGDQPGEHPSWKVRKELPNTWTELPETRWRNKGSRRGRNRA